LSDDCEVVYLTTAAYQPDAEDGLDALDPALGINWPLLIAERSDRDQSHAKIANDFIGVAR
jgi:dTDP-4-dehydrorhamnose 3,5-epimerase